MAVRAVFFDFGGTLVKQFRDAYPVYESVLRSRGIAVRRDVWEEASERSLRRIEPLRYALLGRTPSWGDRVTTETLRELRVEDPGGEITRALHDHFTSESSHPPFPESEVMVRELRQRGLAVHVVSNNIDWLPETISHLGWTSLFDGVTYSQEVGAEKPDPRVFRVALQRARCRPDEVLHVGDSWEADYLGAKRVGLRAVWLNREGTPPPAPCESLRSLRELAGLLGE